MSVNTTTDIRNKWQQKALELWVASQGRGIVEAGTGTGKTYLGFKVASRYLEKRGPSKIDVVVPTRLLKEQWEDSLPESLMGYVTVYVINTYVKTPRDCDLLILDEMHNYAAPKFKGVLRTKYKHLLGLTATLKRKDGEHVLLMRHAPLIYRLPIEIARKLGFVSDFQVYNLGVEFTDPIDKDKYKRAHSSFVNLFRFFNYDFQAMMAVVKGNTGLAARLAHQHGEKTEKIQQFAFMAMNSMKARKKLLYEAQSKIPIVKEIVDKCGGQTIIFTQTIDSCDKIVNAIGDAQAYHSGIKGTIGPDGKRIPATKVKQQIIKHFENGVYPRLVGAKALNEGFSVNEVEVAIFFSYTSDIRTFVQRMGRAVRFVKGKKAKIIALYMKPFKHNKETVHSQELKWLKEAQKSNIGTVKWVDSVDEIINDVPSVTF